MTEIWIKLFIWLTGAFASFVLLILKVWFYILAIMALYKYLGV